MIESILTFLTELLKFIGHPFKSRKAGDEITKIASIYDEMRNITQNPTMHIYRFLILIAHNGGSNIKSYTPAYCSALHEEIRPPMMPVKVRYQKVPMDSEYIRMLTELYVKKTIDLDVTTMPPSFLRDLYISEGVRYSRMFFLKQNKKYFWFCTVATMDDNEKLDEPFISIPIAMAVNTIKNIINS